MKRILVAAILSLTATVPYAKGQTITPDVERRASDIVSQMTLDEKLAYVGGYNHFYIRPIERLGVPEIRMADGPQGVRNNTQSTLYPCGIALAATWSRDLANLYGSSIGRDARARGVHIMLGPGVNIYRSPLNGRNFEYYGEDPYLASETAVAYIKGMQAQGVMATIKHFCGNNQEWDRHHVSSDIDERTLQEIYLPTFRKAVQEAQVGAVMSSYNLVNGVHMSENRELLRNTLRDKWGFKGIHMSDWVATYSPLNAANNGLDLEMPSGKMMNPDTLRQAIETGRITEQTIDEKCRHILQSLIAFGFLDRCQKDSTILENNPESNQVALDVAREAIVLLKNENTILPLARKMRNIVVAGPNASVVPTGGGSGFVSPFETVSIVEGLTAADKRLRVKTLTADGSDKQVASADAVVYCAGFNSKLEGEGHDRPFSLPQEQIDEIAALAALNPNLIVVVNAGGAIDFSPVIDKAQALLLAWYPGQAGGQAIAEILTGQVNPSGRLPISIERQASDNPSFANYHAEDNGPRKNSPRRVSYNEGVFGGYRGYDRSGIEPLFPFGYGGSYTTFSYSNPEVKSEGDEVIVTFDVTNTGRRAGADVAQLYVKEKNSRVPRPDKELKSYDKVYLQPGQTKPVKLVLKRDDLGFYDMNQHDFTFEQGEYEFMIGRSSGDIQLTLVKEL